MPPLPTPMERGEASYRSKDYQGALEAFSLAIQNSGGQMLMAALDRRAATYQKMGDLKKALRDARAMIDADPQHTRGYLRCGEVLKALKKEDIALQIYERGLQKVKIGDAKRPSLQGMYNLLKAKMPSKKDFDPLRQLPRELAIVVVTYLSTADHLRCLTVTKAWKSFLESVPEIWYHFDTSQSRRMLTDKAIKAHGKRAGGLVRSAKIRYPERVDRRLLEKIFHYNRSVGCLEVIGEVVGPEMIQCLPVPSQLRQLTITNQISWTSIMLCLKHIPTLAVAEFGTVVVPPHLGLIRNFPQMPNLTDLAVIWHSGPDARTAMLRDFGQFHAQMPKLRALTLRSWVLCDVGQDYLDFAQWPDLEYLDVGKSLIYNPLRVPTHLKYLDVLLFQRPNPHTFAHIPNTLPPLPLLEVLKCSRTNDSGPGWVKTTTDASRIAGNLKTLSFGDIYYPSLTTPHAPPLPTFEPFPSVTALSVARFDCSEEILLKVIVGNFPNVEILNLEATKITGYGIKKCVETMPSLTYVNVRQCEELGRDAVDYMRKKGIEVRFALSNPPMPRVPDKNGLAALKEYRSVRPKEVTRLPAIQQEGDK